jgi:hypothetical protein
MQKLIDLLKNTTIIALINAKPAQRKNFIFLAQNDTVRTALETFIEHRIEAIPLKNFDGNSDGEKAKFIGLLTLPNLLRFLLQNQNNQILDVKLGSMSTEIEEFIQDMNFIRRDLSLMHLLLNVWNGSPEEMCHCRHLYTVTSDGKYGVITPLDFLRHLLFLNQNTKSLLRDYSAKEIENAFTIQTNMAVSMNDSVKLVLDRLCRSEPHCLLAIVDEENGGLEGDICFVDLLPESKENLETFVKTLQDQEISLAQFWQATSPSRMNMKKTISPILLYPHFTVYDLLEKITRLKVHHLWRVTQDLRHAPIGAVGIYEILTHLHLILKPYIHTIKIVNC